MSTSTREKADSDKSDVLHIALVQANLHWHDAAANRDHFDGLLATVRPDTQLVVLPEMFSTGFTMAGASQAEPMQGATVQWMQAWAARLDAVITGSVIVSADDSGSPAGRPRNRMLWVTPAGPVLWYDKKHLFRMADEHLAYDAGDDHPLLVTGSWTLLPAVCYDLRFPGWLRQGIARKQCSLDISDRDAPSEPVFAQTDFDAMVLVANWPAARDPAWRVLLQARAIENQCYVVAVNRVGSDGNGVDYCGSSMIITPEGDVLADAGCDEQVLHGQIDRVVMLAYRQKFPAWQDRDVITLDD